MKIKYSIFFFFVFLALQTFSQNFSIFEIEDKISFVSDKIQKNEFELAQKALAELESLKVENQKVHGAKVKYYQAQILQAKGDDEKSLELFLEGYSTLKEVNSYTYVDKYIQSIGGLFLKSKNYDTAIEYFREGLGDAKHKNDSVNISRFYYSIGNVKRELRELDSVKYYYERVLKFSPKYRRYNESIPETYSHLSEALLLQGDFALSEEYAKKSYQIYKIKNDTLQTANSLFKLGRLKYFQSDWDGAKDYYYQSLDLLETFTCVTSNEIESEVLFELSKVSHEEFEYKRAYDYLMESYTISQDVISGSIKNTLSEIEVKYNIVERERLAQAAENKKQRAEFWLLILVFTICALLAIITISFRVYNLKKQKIVLNFKNRQMIQSRELERIKIDSQVKILNATLDAKEEERKQIAEILHDNVSTMLSSANMHLKVLRSVLKDKTLIELDKIELILAETSTKIRDLSHSLISSVLLKFGLSYAIEDICEKYSNSHLIIESDSLNVVRYESKFEIIIFSIVEELINNIIKHSEASKASINIEDLGALMEIRISDNGVGFDQAQINNNLGLGISHISARIKNLGGNFTINPSDSGTRVFISVPIKQL